MSSYSDDDYLRLLAKYHHVERQLAAAKEPAPPVAQGEYDGLIERLRSPAMVFYEYAADDGMLLRAAADAIAALQAKVQELQHERKALASKVEAVEIRLGRKTGKWLDYASALVAYLEDAEAERDAAQARIAELEGALNSIAANTCCDTCQEAALVARAALAKGES